MLFPSLLLPGLTAVLAAVFAVAVVRRWRNNRRPYLLLWAIGIGAFGIGAGAEAAFRLFGWNPLFFRIYYLCGAILAAAWLGQGTVQLLGRRPWPQISLAVLLLLSLYGVFEVARAQLEPAFMSRRIGAVSGSAGISPTAVVRLAGNTVATPNGTLMDVWSRAIADKAGVDLHTVATAPEAIPYGLQRGNVAVGTVRML